MHSFSLITSYYNSAVIPNNWKSVFVIVFIVLILTIGIEITRSSYRSTKTARILLASQKVQLICDPPKLVVGHDV